MPEFCDGTALKQQTAGSQLLVPRARTGHVRCTYEIKRFDKHLQHHDNGMFMDVSVDYNDVKSSPTK